MGRRKNYPWDSRRDKKMNKLVSGLLTGLILAPFALASYKPRKKRSTYKSLRTTREISKPSNIAINNTSTEKYNKKDELALRLIEIVFVLIFLLISFILFF